MEKKDIYEHLARIYLDSSHKAKKKTFSFSGIILPLAIVVLACLLIVALLVLHPKVTPKPAKLGLPETSYSLYSDMARLNFNFGPVKSANFDLDLGHMDLTAFQALSFSARKSDYKENLFLRVEIVNSLKEKSSTFVKDISNTWNEFKVDLSYFSDITDWTSIEKLSFVIEEWNVERKHGALFLENIKLIKK